MSALLIAPYLPIADEATLRSWELLPFKKIAESHQVPQELRRSVTRLVDAYGRDSDGAAVLGAVAYPSGTHVGAEFDRASMPQLAHALLAGAVADNPAMAAPEDEQSPNAGHAVATSENALLFGHPLDETGDSYVIETGVLARVIDYRSASGDEPLPKVEAPVELPKPLFGGFDTELANAVLAALDGGDSNARRLHRALDWYRIALSNAEAVSLDVRVGATRSALEVLTDASDETKRLVRAYGNLLRNETTSVTTYDHVFWARGPVQLTPDEWWLTRLCDLRNEVVHGHEVPEDLWSHEGHHQLNHMHDRLIQALRVEVAARVGDPLLLLPQGDRVFARLAEEMQDRLGPADETEPPGDDD